MSHASVESILANFSVPEPGQFSGDMSSMRQRRLGANCRRARRVHDALVGVAPAGQMNESLGQPAGVGR
jgi:hypothetical protein